MGWIDCYSRDRFVLEAKQSTANAREPVLAYLMVEKAAWPTADYIVGNPPFIGNKRMRQALGDGYVEAVRDAWADVPETADFVMYWWHHAAALVVSGEARRFGLITTNSITQAFNRGVVQRQLDAGLTLAWAISDHPWVDAAEGAAVRVAMTVGAHSAAVAPAEGRLLSVASEGETVGDAPQITYAELVGTIHANLSNGADTLTAIGLLANEGLSCPGVKLHGAGFIVCKDEASKMLRDGEAPESQRVIRKYLNGKDLLNTSREAMVIDAFGLTEDYLRKELPTIYQRLLERVKPERDSNNRSIYRQLWWIFGEPRAEFRPALMGVDRYVVTAVTAKHRMFVFLESDVLPDDALMVFASSDAFVLGVLSSRAHVLWTARNGATLEDRPRYIKSTCFDTFPFPACKKPQLVHIRALGEELDAHRKRQQAKHPGLTLTGMYNVLAKLRGGETLTAKEKSIHEQGLCSVLKHIHDRLDVAVAEAYGWPNDMTDERIIERLVDLNATRAAEEVRGEIRWLRPDYQKPLHSHKSS